MTTSFGGARLVSSRVTALYRLSDQTIADGLVTPTEVAWQAAGPDQNGIWSSVDPAGLNFLPQHIGLWRFSAGLGYVANAVGLRRCMLAASVGSVFGQDGSAITEIQNQGASAHSCLGFTWTGYVNNAGRVALFTSQNSGGPLVLDAGTVLGDPSGYCWLTAEFLGTLGSTPVTET